MLFVPIRQSGADKEKGWTPKAPTPFGRPQGRQNFRSRSLAIVDCILQALAGRELRHVACRNVDFRTRGWVAALAGFATRNREGAKADETPVSYTHLTLPTTPYV